MALQLMKLMVTANTTTDVFPTSEKFFYVTNTATPAGGTLNIQRASFFDDGGATPAELPELATDNSYFKVYINGVLQMNGISTYTDGENGSLSIEVPGDPQDDEGILSGTPIVLEVVNFSPVSDTEVQT